MQTCFNRDPYSDVSLGRRVFGYYNKVNSRYLEFGAGLEDAKNNQPNHPVPPFGANLLEEIQLLLKAKPEELQFLTTMCGPLDFHHDVSAFIEYGGVIVTMRAVMRKERHSPNKYVDILVDGEDDNLQKTAQEIIGVFELRLRKKHSKGRRYIIR